MNSTPKKNKIKKAKSEEITAKSVKEDYFLFLESKMQKNKLNAEQRKKVDESKSSSAGTEEKDIID